MDVGEVRVAEDKDFEILKIYLSRNDGWRLEYEKGSTAVWTRAPPEEPPPKQQQQQQQPDVRQDDTAGGAGAFKMIRLKTRFVDVSPLVLYDVLHDPEYRRTWDRFMLESKEIGHLNPNNNISYYAISCPSPMKNRDFVIQSSWLQTPKESMIINHSVFHQSHPCRKGFVRGTSYMTGFLITPLSPAAAAGGSGSGSGCELGYITHTNPKGNLPIWVSNKLSSTFAPKLVRKLHKACLRYPAWKEVHCRARKPWLFPEQISTPRVNLQDCQKSDLENNSSSPEESPEEEIIDTCDMDNLSDTE